MSNVKKKQRDPLGLNINKRLDNDLKDSIPNDWLEAVAIFLALIAITGAGVTLYHLAGKV